MNLNHQTYKYSIISIIITSVLFLNSGVLPDNSKKDKKDKKDKKNNYHWYRGNTHAHAKFSDKEDNNDVPEIAKWYEKSGYDFLILSEHSEDLVKKKVICHDEAADPPDFIMLCGLELTKSRHLTALGINKFITGGKSLQEGVNETLAAGGVPILNHPEEPVVSAKAFIQTKGLNHLEIFNGHNPQDTPAVERLWDSVLSAPDGRIVYALASDDNHYKKSDTGKGWIMVDSPTLSKEAIKESIRTGKFYASTGIYLKDYIVSDKSIEIDTKNGDHIIFIGKSGKILQKTEGHDATYHFKGGEHYVRAVISNDNGKSAWTQPVAVK